MNRRLFITSSLGALALAQRKRDANAPSALGKKIVLIGGVKSHGPAQHDFPNGIPRIASFLKSAVPFKGAEIVAYADGFPRDLSSLEGAATLVFYFDGVQTPPAPLLDPARISEIEKLMKAGVGLVCLHQASTVPTGDSTIPLIEWLGAKRNGMFDRTTEPVTLSPATPSFPICRGMTTFTYEDEFYPTLIYTKEAKLIVPILRAKVPKEAPLDHILAWAYERPNGGRSFGFTGLHYLSGLDQPNIRKMVLNAICWTSGLVVPPAGVIVEIASV